MKMHSLQKYEWKPILRERGMPFGVILVGGGNPNAAMGRRLGVRRLAGPAIFRHPEPPYSPSLLPLRLADI